MGKVRRIGILVSQRAFLFRLGTSFVAVLGVASAALAILGWHLDVIYAGPFAVFALLLSAFIASRGLVTPLLPVGDVLVSNIDSNVATRVHCPCDSKLRAEAKRLAQQCFATTFTIDPKIYEQLWLKNKYILACLTDHNDEMLGYFDVIPLKQSFAEPFLRGLVSETQVSHEEVLPSSEMASCAFLYIAGIAVWNPETYAGRRNANILVWALLQYLEKFYAAVHPLVIAVASTDAGDDLLRRFRLNWENGAEVRADKGRLYSIRLTEEELKKRQACLPDWSGLCALDWSGASSNVVVRMKDIKRRRHVSPPKVRHWELSSTGTDVAGR